MHEGSGRGYAFVDCASEEQLRALARIWRGQEGGADFEISNPTLVEPTAVERATVEVALDGPRSRVAVGTAVDAAMTPLVDPAKRV